MHLIVECEMKNDDITTQPYVLTLMSQKGNCIVNQEADPPIELRSGDQCPSCQQDTLDYDGLLNLTCPSCGYAVSGCFT